MINLETLRKGPESKPAPLPVLTEEEVRANLIHNIEEARAITDQTAIFGETQRDTTKTLNLFYIDAEKELSLVYKGSEKVGKFGRYRFQEIGFEIMSQYGLDPSKYKPEHTEGAWDSAGSCHYGNGTSREFLIYPSQTISGLQFERWRDYYTETNETIFVGWSVQGQKQPFRLRLVDLVLRR